MVRAVKRPWAKPREPGGTSFARRAAVVPIQHSATKNSRARPAMASSSVGAWVAASQRGAARAEPQKGTRALAAFSFREKGHTGRPPAFVATASASLPPTKADAEPQAATTTAYATPNWTACSGKAPRKRGNAKTAIVNPAQYRSAAVDRSRSVAGRSNGDFAAGFVSSLTTTGVFALNVFSLLPDEAEDEEKRRSFLARNAAETAAMPTPTAPTRPKVARQPTCSSRATLAEARAPPMLTAAA
mmetsp:Transcript_9960/g.32490  ORF Transcript_9960/g.32490 Transcript_9960/m.32490 type:complete len:244 (+) Transcript_9960:377-1108(+)